MTTSIKTALIAIVLIVCMLFGAGMIGKWYSDRKWQAFVAEADRDAERRYNELAAKAMERERQLNADLANLYAKFKKEQADEKQKTDTILADIGSGALRLWAPVNTATGNADSSGSGIGLAETRAELDRPFAQSLVAIAADGDAAIRELNMCIDAYDRVRVMNGRQSRYRYTDIEACMWVCG